MQYLYCDSCGGRTAQTATLAKFCSACGEPFVKMTQATTKPHPGIIAAGKALNKNKKRRVIEEPDDVEDDDDDIEGEEDYGFDDDEDRASTIEPISASEIDQYVEIDVSPSKPLAIQDIARGSENSKPTPFKTAKAPKISKKDFQKQWEKEAGTSRKGNR